jgi:magnesium chelatase subunit I
MFNNDNEILESKDISANAKNTDTSEIKSLKDLIERVSGKNIPPIEHEIDSGFADPIAFPFLAIVGQYEMKLALSLALINPLIGGVLLIGPRGTGKTSAVRSLIDILPEVEISNCFYGCMPDDVEFGGLDAICPNCAEKYSRGISLTKTEPVHLVELPLNAELVDVIGGLDDRQLTHHRMRLKRGILASADKNILYIDEVNLLSDDIINAILDASAMGKYTIRRGPVSATYRSKFNLIGSMNPEEGNLRPQILDRFGLRIITRGLDNDSDRLEAYQRAVKYKTNPRSFLNQYMEETELAKIEIEEAQNLVWNVRLSKQITKLGTKLIRELNIDSIRAEITLFESAKALAAADRRTEVTLEDLIVVAPLSLRLRSSTFMDNFVKQTKKEEEFLNQKITDILKAD